LVPETDDPETPPRPPSRRDGYRIEAIDGELLLHHPGETKVVYCNETAALVWHLCDGRRTPRDIMDLLAAVFPDVAADVAHDVTAAIEQLRSSDVLTS
jgi:hypothetical protein